MNRVLILCLLAFCNRFQNVGRAQTTPTNCVEVSSRLVAWWPGDDSAYDLLGVNHGTLKGGLSFQNGLVGRAFRFDGTSGYLEAAAGSQWNFGGDEFSIVFWANFQSTKRSILMACDEGSGVRNKWMIEYQNSELHFHYVDGVSLSTARVVYPVRFPFIPQINRWYHVAVTKDIDTYRIYLDGEVVAIGRDSGPVASTIAPLTIGWGESSFFFQGSLDEIAIYRKRLTGSELSQLWGAGAAGICKQSRIIRPLENQEVRLGSTVRLSIGTISPEPLSYSWQVNGTNIKGADGPTLEIARFGTNNIGTYTVTVSNPRGFIATSSSLLTTPLFDLQLYAGLSFDHPVGSRFRIEYRTTLQPEAAWTVLTNLTLPTQPFLFIDTESFSKVGGQYRFYRAVKLP